MSENSIATYGETSNEPVAWEGYDGNKPSNIIEYQEFTPLTKTRRNVIITLFSSVSQNSLPN